MFNIDKFFRKDQPQDSPKEELETLSSTDLVLKALKELNCHPNVDTTDRNDQVIYFKYQGMNFRAFTFAAEDNDTCNLDYHAGVYSFAQLEYLRQVCNSVNTSVLPVHLYLVPDPKEYKYNLYATATITDVRHLPSLSECIAKMIEMFFVAQRSFEEAMKKKEEEDTEDEESMFMSQHEVWMTREMEVILNQDEKDDLQPCSGELLCDTSLTDFLENIYNIPSVEIESVAITTNSKSELVKDTLRIHSMPLLAPLIENLETPEKTKVMAKTASVTVNFIDNTGESHNIIIIMRVENEEQKTIYVRLSAMRNGDCISIDNLWGSTRNMPKAETWLMAVDKTTENNSRAELKYKLEEARKKAENNENVTEEELFLLRISTFPHLSDSEYRGRKLFNQKRYREALRHFENINEYLEERFFDDFWDDLLRENYAHNCYYIGFCYTELGDPLRGATFMEKACLIYPCPMHQIGHIKALYRAGDFRLIHVVRSLMDNIEAEAEKLKDDEVLPEAQLELYDFLQQAMALALIKYGKYDEAIARLKGIIANGPEPTRHWAEQKLREISK